jgi:hypothetical protein
MAEYKGKKVRLMKPRRIREGSPGFGRKKFEVFVKSGDRIVRVTFGDPNMTIKRYSDKNRRSYRARHKCDINPPKDPTKARYWSCKFWESGKTVTELLSGS